VEHGQEGLAQKPGEHCPVDRPRHRHPGDHPCRGQRGEKRD
jgi:hypothetical protein